MKRVLLIVLLLPSIVGFAKERRQWTEKQAWAWEKKVGTIIGFNEEYRSLEESFRTGVQFR